MAMVVMPLEDVASGAAIETRGRLVSASEKKNNVGRALCGVTGQHVVKGGRAVGAKGEPSAEGEKRQIRVFSVKQQLDGCAAAIMNPIEGEQEPGGRPFRGGQKAISTVNPLFVCVCVCVYDAQAPVQVRRGSVREWNCVWH